uniref:Protein phosphatase 1, regulatory subunit 26 n=2 Tax=Cyclopterus lumpus TaxID=8103 RepID=A0A8C2ZXB5_CYCLU
MYLMNVPPVAATQTKWRTCGPPGGYSLPICFNDSDSELSTRGTPISDKVQMIIESLRSTQSSLEMGDEIEENVPSGHEGHPQVCKVAMGSYVGPQSKAQGPTENQPSDVASPMNRESSDSDSDDSVDRGIEEAILEYLKEKDDHKRKAEPCLAFLQSSKIPRKSPPVPEDSKQVSDSNTFLIASSRLPKAIKAETSTPPALTPIKKHIKNRAFLNDNTVEKLDSNKSATDTSLASPTEQAKRLSKTIDKVHCSTKVEVDEESSDSSSDDGIEEAIQRYQREQKEQQNKTETVNPHAFVEESDSTSDDGIEEAIRCYQLEQIRDKSVLKPFLHNQKPFTKSFVPAVGSTSTENMKKHRLRKKKTRAEKEAKSLQHPPPSLFLPKSALLESSNGKGNGSLLFEEDGLKEQPTPAPPKVNTTAELMCAEAILDISKTVMPEAFHHSVGLSSCTPTESSLQSSPPDNRPGEESDGSSIDSEDGIEQEIRKFLEQKAEMQKLLPTATTQKPQPEEGKAKVATLKKPSRLSLTQRRRHKEGNGSVSIASGTEDNVKETSLKPGQESGPLAFSQGSQTHPIAGVCKVEQTGDKSSSLDSDEDLDTAIKDLLKTKKKSKKKTRDLKRKSRVSPREEEPHRGNDSENKKFKPDPLVKRSLLKQLEKSKEDMKDKAGLSKKSLSQHKPQSKSKEHDDEGEPAAGGQVTTLSLNARTALEMKEDSSSVDSDDSIELEIRRFLAEKAKVSTAEKSKDGDVSRNGTAAVCTALRDEDIKRENQLAEIPSICPLSGQSPPRSRPLPTPNISPDGAQSRLSSVQSCSQSPLEPADGAGAARTEQWRPGRDVAPQLERVRPVAGPNLAESIKWRQSLGLPATDTRTTSRSPFHITSSKMSETASGAPPYQSGGHKSQTPVTAWSSARTSRAPFPCSTETSVNATYRFPVFTHLSAARQPPRTPFARSLAPGHRSQRPVEGEAQSMVHMSKDKSVFVELESNRTNHVQVRSRERREGREQADLLSEIKREGESVEIDDKRVHLGRAEEEFIDEADCESANRRNPEKKQGFPTL